MPISIKAKSDKAVIDALNSLPEKIQAQAFKKATGRLGTKLKKTMQEGTPVATGALKRSWGKESRQDQGRGSIKSRAGIRHQYQDRKTDKIPNMYAGIVDAKSRHNKGFKRRAFGRFAAKGKQFWAEAVKEAIAKVNVKK